MIPDDHKAAIEQMAASGMTDAQVGAQYGVSSEKASSFRRKHGIQSRIKRSLKRSRETRFIPSVAAQDVREMVQRGMSDPQIAKAYGCSGSAVNQFRRCHAIPARIVLTAPAEVKGKDVRFDRPKELEGYHDATIGHWVRVFETMPAIGDLRPENENDGKRELEKALHPGSGCPQEGGERPNHNPGWTNL